MTCVVEFEPHSLWHEVSLAIAKQALGRGIKTEYHVFQHTPAEIRLALHNLGAGVEKLEREGLFRVMDSYTPTTPLTGPMEGRTEPLLSGRAPDAGQWASAIQTKMKTGFEEEEKRWLHIDDNETVLLEFSDEESIMNGWRTTFVPMAKARELLILHSLVTGVASDSFYRKTEAMADAVIDISTKEVRGRLENYVRLRVLRGVKFDSSWHRVELTSNGEIAVEAARPEELSEGQRRLEAVMFTDMVGFTALTQSNESRALEVLELHNRLLRPFFPKFHGREVKTMGDSFLVEFDSALDATNCALEIQRFLHEYNVSSKDEWKITLRIGIHLGDVVHSGGDIVGDAVNIASRLHPLAEPEGICVSDQVFGQVRNKVPQTLVKMAPQDLKNVRFPIDVYRVVMPWSEERVLSSTQMDKKRIAVLPFVNMSPDPNDEYFADGMTEELISATSTIKNLTVIARTSVMRYKGLTKSVEDIGNDLSVGTVLEGSVRKAGNRLRISVQLIDVQSQGHLWAQSYDRDLDDVFAVQSDIAKRVADALRVRMLTNEALLLEKKPTKSIEAYTLYLKGRHYWNERSKEGLLKAIEYFNLALAKDPNYSLACSGISDCYAVLGDHEFMPYDEAFAKTKEYALRAVRLDDSSAEARTSLGDAFLVFNEWDGAEREFKRALELNPRYATAHQWYGILLFRMGRLEEALREVLLAGELDPVSPQIKVFTGKVYDSMGEHDKAEEQLQNALELDPNIRSGHAVLTDVYIHAGRFDDAKNEAETLLRLTNNDPFARGYLAVVYAFKGDEKEARRIIAELNGAQGANQSLIAALLRLGDKEEAIELIQKEFEGHANWLPELAFNPDYRSVKSDPRVTSILMNFGSHNHSSE